MRTIAICCSKGGGGKTTLLTSLAVQAVAEGARVAMLDLNADQGSLTQWFLLRGSPDNPELVDHDADLEDIAGALDEEGFDFLLIDTPPISLDTIEAAVVVADAVLVPVRPGAFDMLALDAVVDLCQQHQKPFSFVLTAVDAKLKTVADAARREVASLGPVVEQPLSYRKAYMVAANSGKAAAETDKALAAEAAAIWSAAVALTDGGAS